MASLRGHKSFWKFFPYGQSPMLGPWKHFWSLILFMWIEDLLSSYGENSQNIPFLLNLSKIWLNDGIFFRSIDHLPDPLAGVGGSDGLSENEWEWKCAIFTAELFGLLIMGIFWLLFRPGTPQKRGNFWVIFAYHITFLTQKIPFLMTSLSPATLVTSSVHSTHTSSPTTRMGSTRLVWPRSGWTTTRGSSTCTGMALQSWKGLQR